MISGAVHPTNDYQFRHEFIERNIGAIIAYFTHAGVRLVDGNIDLARLYHELRKNRMILLTRENMKKQQNFRFIFYKRIQRLMVIRLSENRKYPDELLLKEINEFQDHFQ